MGKQHGEVSSPQATGGAGTIFEQHVDAAFLAWLLVRAIPPVLTDCQLDEVHFQTGHLGWHTDDILVVGTNGAGQRRQLVGQIKKSFTVSSKDDYCRKVFTGFWQDYSDGSRFQREYDRLALIIQLGTKLLLGTFRSLLDCARASLDAADFARRLAMDGYIDQKASQYVGEISSIINEANGSAVSDEEIWQFLKVINVLSLDLNTSTAQTEAVIKSLLAHTANERDKLGAADATWNQFLAVAGKGMPTAHSHTWDTLPDNLKQRHAQIVPADHGALRSLKDHGTIVMDGICGTIGGTVEISRDQLVTQLLGLVNENQVVMVTGAAGYGKSVLGKEVFALLEKDHFAFAFRAEEFAKPHLDDTLQRAFADQGAKQLFALLSGQERKLLVVESVERLLEASVRDSFADLLRLIRLDQSWRLVITCRDYSLDIVSSSLLEPANLSPAVLRVPLLTDEELNDVIAKLPQLERPASNDALRKLFRNPYYLDKAARMDWPEDAQVPHDERSFRAKFWCEVVRDEAHTANGLPQRRENVFRDIAIRRAKALSLFALCEDFDRDALDGLRNDSLIALSSQNADLAAPAHDVLEDWAILQWIDRQFARHEGSPELMAADIGGFPALRRTYRKWLGEKLECEATAVDPFVLSVVQDESLPLQFRDDTIVSMLLSSSTVRFLSSNRQRLVEQNYELLRRVIHLLRVACVTTPRWLPARQDLASVFFQPDGLAWPAVLQIVMEEVDGLLPGTVGLVVGLIEDWARGVALWSPSPAGMEHSAKIAFALLPHFEGYGLADLRKRTLQVIAKIPKGDSDAFLELIHRTGEKNRCDNITHDFAEILLGGIEGGFACRDFPDEMIQLAEKHFYLTEDDISSMTGYSSSMDMESYFGLQQNLRHDYFPASAFRGPFLPLLRWHPCKGVEFIIRLLNHAVEWYAQGKWLGNRLETPVEVSVAIPENGEVTQWVSGRLWCVFRGITVAPYLLQSALMALESWLLERCDDDDFDLESYLLRLLRESNNAAVTAVVASLSIAHPRRAGKAGVSLLTCKTFFDLDRARMSHEQYIPNKFGEMFPAIDAERDIYAHERQEADKRPHRRQDLETVAANLQLSEHREIVWQIIDDYRASLPDTGNQTEEDKLWRIALHRIDLRHYQAEQTPLAAEPAGKNGGPDTEETQAGQTGKRTMFLQPGPLDDDIQAMLDQKVPAQKQFFAELSLCNWGTCVWQGELGETIKPDEWQQKLDQAKNRIADGEEIPDHLRYGPGFVAAVCVRDHWEEMDPVDQDWCVDLLIIEVERQCDSDDLQVQISRSVLDSSRPAAYVLPFILSYFSDDKTMERLRKALAISLTHAAEEVVLYAAAGIGHYLRDSHGDFTSRCVGALAKKASLVANLYKAQENVPYEEQRKYQQLVRDVLPDVRQIIIDGSDSLEDELTKLDLDTWSGREAIKPILTILGHSPEASEAITLYAMVASTIVGWWDDEHQDRKARPRLDRNFHLENDCLRRVAEFILHSSEANAIAICEHLLEAVDTHPREVADFIKELIIAEDQSEGSTRFWDMWEAFADRIRNARWLEHLDSSRWSESELIYAIFFGIPWKEGVCHWHRLEGSAGRIDQLLEDLPAKSVVFQAYTRFLYTIGQQSLPDAFALVARRLRAGDTTKMLSGTDVTFCLESLLRRFVYGVPFRVKSNSRLREAVLTILDALVESGSSAAYRMRDDFVTPIAGNQKQVTE